MRLSQPENTRTYYLSLLDELLTRRQPEKLYLGNARTCASRGGDPPVKIHEYSRLKIMLRGSQGHGFSRGGGRIDITLKIRQAIHWGPHAWTLPRHDRQCVFFGMVFHPQFMRLLIGKNSGDGTVPPAPCWYHTATPLSGPGAAVLTAINEQCEQECLPKTELQLFNALLQFTREHLAADGSAGIRSKAVRTWQRVVEYLNQNYAEPLSRESVATALDLHPNYVSALCKQVGQKSFHGMLEVIRINRARRLLRHSELTLDRIAQLCGYSATNYFIKVFRRACHMTPGRFRIANGRNEII